MDEGELYDPATRERVRARNWIQDLEGTEGRCPRCGHDRFRYLAVTGTGVPVVRIEREDDVPGEQLLAARREQDWL